MMRRLLFTLLYYSGLPFLFRHFWQRDKATIIVFHKPRPEVVARNIERLKRRYNIISLADYLKACRDESRPLPPYALILTFDDGYGSNYGLHDVLHRLKVPATIFLCAGIVNTNRRFWFSLDALPVEKESLKQLSNQERLVILAQAGYTPEQEFSAPEALNRDQILNMKDAVDFQSHTLSHPSLPHCEIDEARKEIALSKQVLEKEYGLSIYALAYPNGDYAAREIELCQEAGYQCALTLKPGYNDRRTNPYELKRFCIRDEASWPELMVKASGVWGMLKRLRKGSLSSWQLAKNH
jgi:peptidoglycan/xylan/chitin deacetylase (PgdA/CDA1 family)